MKNWNLVFIFICYCFFLYLPEAVDRCQPMPEDDRWLRNKKLPFSVTPSPHTHPSFYEFIKTNVHLLLFFFIYLKPWTDLHQCLRMTGDLVVATAWRLLTQWRNYSGSFVCYWKIERKAFSIRGRLCKKLSQHFGQLCLSMLYNSKLSMLIVDL